jgi:hypothetical protein
MAVVGIGKMAMASFELSRQRWRHRTIVVANIMWWSLQRFWQADKTIVWNNEKQTA